MCIVVAGAPAHQNRLFLPNGNILRKQAKGGGGKRTPVHCSQHARDKPIDTPTLFDERDQRRNAAFIISGMPEVREN